MAELETRDRKRIRNSDFAYVDAEGEGYLPIQDESHVRNAIARYNQTEFESKAAKGRARKKITAAKMHKIGVDEDEQIARPVTSLRAASTKAGPRGGRKEN